MTKLKLCVITILLTLNAGCRLSAFEVHIEAFYSKKIGVVCFEQNSGGNVMCYPSLRFNVTNLEDGKWNDL